MNLKAALLGLILLWSPAEIFAQVNNNSANTMLPGCRDFLAMVNDTATAKQQGNLYGGICAGIIASAMGYQRMFESKHRACIPQAVTIQQAMEVVVKFLNARPELWHEDFRFQVAAILKVTWPCGSG